MQMDHVLNTPPWLWLPVCPLLAAWWDLLHSCTNRHLRAGSLGLVPSYTDDVLYPSRETPELHRKPPKGASLGPLRTRTRSVYRTASESLSGRECLAIRIQKQLCQPRSPWVLECTCLCQAPDSFPVIAGQEGHGSYLACGGVLTYTGPPEEMPYLAGPVCWGKEQQELDSNGSLGFSTTTKSLYPCKQEP